MLQTLKKQSKKKILLKARIKKFLKHELYIYLVVISSIILCAWLFDKWIETTMFCIAHISIRNAFDRQFHFNKTAYCLSLTLAIVWFAIPITLPLASSLLSSMPIAFAICLFGFIAQDRIEVYKQTKALEIEIDSLTNEIKLYKHFDIYNMPQDKLRQFAAANGLSEVELDILCLRVYEHLKISEICKAMHYGRTTIKYHLGQIKRKLNITTL